MANSIQQAVIAAMDTLVNNRIDNLAVDKTITGVIIECRNQTTGEYRVGYKGGEFNAFAEDVSVTYKNNKLVYVLVPEGNFSKKKIILGEASETKDEGNLTFVTDTLGDYDKIGQNVISVKEGQDDEYGLHSYLAQDFYLLYSYETPENNILNINLEEFKNYLRESEALVISGSFRTKLPREHRITKTGLYGMQMVLAFQDQDDPRSVKYVSYAMDCNNMTGNPYVYENMWSEQYLIFPIDVDNFLYIDSIIFYSQDFEAEDNIEKDEEWGADIWLRDVELYGLRPIETVNGFRLKVSTPYGSTFTSTNPSDTLEAVATVFYQQNTVTKDLEYMWFVEDGRITAKDEVFNGTAGAGWRQLEASTPQLTIKETDNKAYENQYLCITIYKEQIILKNKFTIYNEAYKRDIKIISDLGTAFGFDRGIPLLTCTIKDRAENFGAGEAPERPDSWYSFYWQILDMAGYITLLDTDYDDLLEKYNEAKLGDTSFAELESMRNQLNALEGIGFPKGVHGNQLKYPIKQIDKYLNVKCSVYMKDSGDGEEYFAGSYTLTLVNDSTAEPNTYSIIIVNGDQVFQYSETGIAPTSDRYQDPQKVLPLSCRFYDPTGLEVNPDTYTVKWKVPLEESLITLPEEGLVVNPVNGLLEYYPLSDYPLAIVDNFNYQALKNQVTCIVTYNNQEFSKESELTFLKVGDNGTNGTDLVGKISPTSDSTILDRELLTLQISPSNRYTWNTGQQIYSKVLDFSIYYRNEQIIPDNVRWSVSGSSSKYMSVNDGVVSWGSLSGSYRNQIVKAQTNVSDSKGNYQTYYAFYPIPIVQYRRDVSYHVGIDKEYTLKQILYNADGRNPLYNKNQGVKISLTTTGSGQPVMGKRVVWNTMGGKSENAATAAFKLIANRDDDVGNIDGISITGVDGSAMTYILPDEVYSGAFTNNIVHGFIYDGSTLEVEFWMPLYMSLNTYGLASLNKWDGNHVEINEDESYIMAPQIGAGIKESDNSFTGIVMGSAQTYDAQNQIVGLLGYKKGKQSIFMDAETGNTYLGLASNDSMDRNNPEVEGRIELIPGGVSSIAGWKFERRALYNVVNGSIDNPYSDAPRGARRSVPHASQGILLNADPTYVSIKGRTLTASDVNADSANRVVNAGDALEIQMDPNDISLFTIYRHYLYSGRWRRTPLVGIDGLGRFYANTLKAPADGSTSTQTTAFSIGYVGAFGSPASSAAYIGGVVDIGDISLFKMFTPIGQANSRSGTLYLSGGSSTSNEYQRTMSFHANSFGFHAATTGTTATTENRFILPGNASTTCELIVNSDMTIQTGGTRNLNITSGPMTLTTRNQTIGVTGSVQRNISSTLTETIGSSCTQTISSSLTYSVGGRSERTFTGAATLNYGSSLEENINNNLTKTVGGTATYNYNRSKTETIANGYTQTVNAGSYKVDAPSSKTNATFNYGGSYTETIGTNFTTTIGRDETENVGGTGSYTYGSHYTVAADSGNAQITSQAQQLTMQLNDCTLGYRNTANGQYIKWPNGNRATLAAYYGLNITATTGPIIGTTNSADGIQFNAGGSSGSYLHLNAQQGGNSDFILNSPNGRVASMSNVGNGFSGVQITAGLSTNWGYFSGTVNGSTNSIVAQRDIMSTGGWLYGGDAILSNLTVQNDHSVANWINNHNKWAGDLETKINNLIKDVDDHIRTANQNFTNIDSRLGTAETNIGNLQSAGFITSSTADSRYVSNTTYNSHTHGVSYDKTTIEKHDVEVRNAADTGSTWATYIDRILTTSPNVRTSTP